MIKAETTKSQNAGCFFAIWLLFVTAPLFLTFGILSAINPSKWVWVLFWSYAPAFIGFLLACVVKFVIDLVNSEDQIT